MRAARHRALAGGNGVVDGLDVVAGGVEHVGAVVAPVVLGPRPRCSVVAPSRLECRGVEGVDRLPAGGGEGEVDPGDGPLARVQDEPPALPASEGQETVALELKAEAQRSQGRLVEPSAGRQVSRPQGDVVYHRLAGHSLSFRRCSSPSTCHVLYGASYSGGGRSYWRNPRCVRLLHLLVGVGEGPTPPATLAVTDTVEQ